MPQPQPPSQQQVQFHAGDGRVPRAKYGRAWVYELDQAARERVQLRSVYDRAEREMVVAVVSGFEGRL